MVRSPTFRIHDGYGPWSWVGSSWQRHLGEPHRVVRSTRLPGRQGPSLAISVVI